MTSLANRALLTNLSISQWTARKLDRHETEEVARRNGTAGTVARVNKTLLPGPNKLDDVARKSGEIRAWFCTHTLPWATDGMHVLRADTYLDFTRSMAAHMSAWRALVQEFVAEYPTLVGRAQHQLNGLYRAEDYPSPDNIAQKFAIDVKFFPVPSDKDWRVTVGDEAMAMLRQQITEEVTRAQTEAMQDAWRRVHECVQHAHERLSDPEAKFRDSLVTNAQKLCELLPKLNIADDPNLERIRQDIEGALARQHPEMLRVYPTVRQSTADKMAEIMGKMGAFYQQAA
jgi:hypothetical protein